MSFDKRNKRKIISLIMLLLMIVIRSKTAFAGATTASAAVTVSGAASISDVNMVSGAATVSGAAMTSGVTLASSGDLVRGGVPVSQPEVKEVKELQPEAVPCTNAVLIDVESGRVLFAKNEAAVVKMASTTKIMTALLALEQGSLNEIVTVSSMAANTEGSDISLRAGEQLTLKELLYGLLMNSGNDAAVAIAEHVGGSVEAFADMMTQRAAQIGCVNTAFVTPHGLDEEGHHTTALELAKIARYAMRYDEFNEIVSTRTANITGHALYNTNELLAYYPGADGVKTGYTGLAGRCLVASATNNNMRLISVALGAASRTQRARACSMMLDYGFDAYSPVQVVQIDREGVHTGMENVFTNKNSCVYIASQIPVVKGREKMTSVELEGECGYVAGVEMKKQFAVPIKKGEEGRLTFDIEAPSSLCAPVLDRVEIGCVVVSLDGVEVGRRKLVTCNRVFEKSYFDYFFELGAEFGKLVM